MELQMCIPKFVYRTTVQGALLDLAGKFKFAQEIGIIWV